MRQLYKTNIALIFFYFIFSQAIAQKINFEPVDAYWKMVEPLKQGDSLSVETWNEFLKIEPNQAYIENQGFDSNYLERLRKTIQIVYMPRYDSLLAIRVAAINKDPSSYWMTYKVYVYKKYEKEMKAYQQTISRPAYMHNVYKNVFKWLPKRLRQVDSTVNFHFIAIENDAVAGGGTIIATLWQMYIQENLKEGLLGGHEMHHVLRRPITFENIPEHQEGVMYVLNSIINEGTADMIDKPYNISHDEDLPMGTRFKDFLFFQADSIVRQIDTSITILATSQGRIYKTERDYRDVIRWTSGHCPGYYMADIIVRNGFKKQLVNNIQNPFAFIYLYNKAAKKDAKRPSYFSEASINYIKQLEHNFWEKNTTAGKIGNAARGAGL